MEAMEQQLRQLYPASWEADSALPPAEVLRCAASTLHQLQVSLFPVPAQPAASATRGCRISTAWCRALWTPLSAAEQAIGMGCCQRISAQLPCSCFAAPASPIIMTRTRQLDASLYLHLPLPLQASFQLLPGRL